MVRLFQIIVQSRKHCSDSALCLCSGIYWMSIITDFMYWHFENRTHLYKVLSCNDMVKNKHHYKRWKNTLDLLYWCKICQSREMQCGDSTLLRPNTLAMGRKAGESSGASVCLEWRVPPEKFLMVTLDKYFTGSSSSMLIFESKYWIGDFSKNYCVCPCISVLKLFSFKHQ